MDKDNEAISKDSLGFISKQGQIRLTNENITTVIQRLYNSKAD